MGHVVRSVEWASADDKAAWLDTMATLDARLPVTRALARRFAMSPMHDPNDLDSLARDLHRFWRDSIRYVRDPAGEEFSDSDRVLLCGYGDCDDKARGFVASCRSIGIKARTRPCFDGEEFVHVQAEVSLADGRVGGCFCESCQWILAELIVRDVELGELPPIRSRVLT